VYDEIDRILLILQNEDGSWGTAQSLDERLYQTGWVLHALASQRLMQPIEATFSLLKEIAKGIETNFDLARFAHIRKLLGILLSLPFIFEMHLWINKERFLRNLKRVLDYVESESWINPQLASYAAFFLRNIDELSKYSTSAKSALEKTRSKSGVDCFAAFGSEDYLRRILQNGHLAQHLSKIPDEELAHLLVALAFFSREFNEGNRALVDKVKERVVEIIQKRHLTELDKKVSKEILDLLLLLRTRIDKGEIERRLRALSNDVYVKEIEMTESKLRLIVEIPSGGLVDILGRIDLVVLSAYLYSINAFGEKHVYLVPQSDYEKAKNFFTGPTYAIPKRRALVYETILALPIIGAALFVLYILAGLLSETLSVADPTLRVILIFLIYSSAFLGGVSIFARMLRRLFPELAGAVASKFPSLASSYLTKKILGG
jgi:hypothetical protein